MALYLDGQKIISGGSGSGGHTIVDNEGIDLEQRTNLQFNGAFSEDNATTDTTEINVVREMTKAEFDELTEEEKTGLINITDITSGSDNRFQPVIYSEKEREIGAWIDGRPVYEKTLNVGALPNDTQKNVAHGINNISEIVYLNGIVYSSSLGVAIPIPNAQASTASAYVIEYSVDTTNITITTHRDRSMYNGVITIRYTKSTDAAGSGRWTPQGIPTHHFSTDEQVVGTWIDGKTLYEKVVTKTINCDSETTVFSTTNIPNLNEIISVIGRLGPTLLNNYDTTNYRSYTDVSGTTIKCYCKWGSTSTVEARLIVRYTKTS